MYGTKKNIQELLENLVMSEEPIPPEKRKESIRELASWIEEKEFFTNVNELSSRTIDFCIGEVSEYAESEVKNVGISSIAASSGVSDAEEGRYVGKINLHLPPAREGLEEEIQEGFDLGEDFGMHTGTTALGGVTPAPDGVITPHIYNSDSMRVEPIKELLEKCHEVYVDVYDEGDKTLMELSNS